MAGWAAAGLDHRLVSGRGGRGLTPANARVPLSTYRLQLSAAFTFAEAARLIDYLDALGVSHLYASSYLKARAGSAHGYDIVDHNSLNPEVGDDASFRTMTDALAARGMGHILDFVPNHMGIGRADNAWWLDVLEWGQASAFAGWFDIQWDPPDPALKGKVLVPFLGDHYGTVLENGELKLRFDAPEGRFQIAYHDHVFPVCPASYDRILDPVSVRLRAERPWDDLAAIELERLTRGFALVRRRHRSAVRRAATWSFGERAKRDLATLAAADPGLAAALAERAEALNGTPGDPASFRPLHRLLQAQNYRLAFWRVAADEINYRRFFQINELAGIKMELPEVFDATHRLVLRLIGEGRLQGLRIDHVDGLYDPGAYLAHLHDRAGEAMRAGPDTPPFYIVVEKILAAHERLCPEWPIAGTTGYEFLNHVNGLFVDPAGEADLDRTYRRFTGRAQDFAEVVIASKLRIMDHELTSELAVLATLIDRIAESDWHSRDYTRKLLRDALREVVAVFPIYRSYVTPEGGASTADRRDIDWAVREARRRSQLIDKSVFDFLKDALTLDLVQPGHDYGRRAVARFAMRVQQYTGPVMAKGLEDTAFYRYNRLVSLNDVGGDPRRMGIAPAAFHAQMAERAAAWPHALLATATHDTKRGEDTRLRIDALSEIPQEWGRRVRRWEVLNRPRKARLDERPAPGPEDEYLIYQMLIGAWPLELLDDAGRDGAVLASFTERFQGFVVKALREAKTVTSWEAPNAEYEDAALAFVGRILTPGPRNRFLPEMTAFQGRIARLAMVSGLAQVAVKLCAPGVPDFYQGTELWDLSLVDPDNRRPVDFTRRRRLLADLDADYGEGGPQDAPRMAALLDRWIEGLPKLYVTWRLLHLRRRHPSLFTGAAYAGLGTDGVHADRIFGFSRSAAGQTLVLAVPRLAAALCGDPPRPPLGEAVWGDTALTLPDDVPDRYRNVLTGEIVNLDRNGAATTLPVGRLLRWFPAAVLVGGG